jgi:hypothetical protein
LSAALIAVSVIVCHFRHHAKPNRPGPQRGEQLQPLG